MKNRSKQERSFLRSLESPPTGAPKGIRTPASGLKGQCPRPLDDGGSTKVILHYLAEMVKGGQHHISDLDVGLNDLQKKAWRGTYDPQSTWGMMKTDIIVPHSPLHYPADYGFILNTLAEDGDALDVLVVNYEPAFFGCVVQVRPIGVLKMREETRRKDTGCTLNLRFNDVEGLTHLPRHLLLEIEHFFTEYKTLEEKSTEIFEWQGREDISN